MVFEGIIINLVLFVIMFIWGYKKSRDKKEISKHENIITLIEIIVIFLILGSSFIPNFILSFAFDSVFGTIAGIIASYDLGQKLGKKK